MRVFFTVVGIIAGANVLLPVIMTLVAMIQTDIIQHNPHRTLAHAIFMLPMQTALLGLLGFILIGRGGAAIAGLTALFCLKRKSNESFFAFFATLPFQLFAVFYQSSFLPYRNWFTDPPEADGTQMTVAGVYILLYLPALVLSWLWLRRKMRQRKF